MINYNVHVISTNRADIGLLYDLILLLEKYKPIEPKVVFIGEISTELSLIDNIYPIKNKVFLGKGIKYSNIHSLIKQSKLLAIDYSKYIYTNNKPDFIICLGDRFELLSILQVATMYRVPIVHIHGGDKTYGSLDNETRYAITKLSKIHCAATKEAKKNLINCGEEDWRIKVVGAPGRDILRRYKNLVKKEEFLYKFGIKAQRIAYVAYHPETDKTKENSISKTILDPLISLGIYPIVSRPNPDPYGNKLRKELTEYDKKGSILLLKESLGLKYLSALMEHAEIMIGNSSSGIFEASLFSLPVLNIGIRQNGRPYDKNVFSVDNDKNKILKMIKLYSGKKITVSKSIYDFGNAANNIFNHIKNNIKYMDKNK